MSDKDTEERPWIAATGVDRSAAANWRSSDSPSTTPPAFRDAPQRPASLPISRSAWAEQPSRPAPPPFPIKEQSTPDLPPARRHRRPLGCDARGRWLRFTAPACPAAQGSRAAFAATFDGAHPRRRAGPRSSASSPSAAPRAALATQGAPAYPHPSSARGTDIGAVGMARHFEAAPDYRPTGTLSAIRHARGRWWVRSFLDWQMEVNFGTPPPDCRPCGTDSAPSAADLAHGPRR